MATVSVSKPGHAALGGTVLHSLQARVRASGWADFARRGASFMPLGLMMLLDAWPSMIVVGVALASSGLLFGADFARRRRGSYGALVDLALAEDVLSIPRMSMDVERKLLRDPEAIPLPWGGVRIECGVASGGSSSAFSLLVGEREAALPALVAWFDPKPLPARVVAEGADGFTFETGGALCFLPWAGASMAGRDVLRAPFGQHFVFDSGAPEPPAPREPASDLGLELPRYRGDAKAWVRALLGGAATRALGAYRGGAVDEGRLLAVAEDVVASPELRIAAAVLLGPDQAGARDRLKAAAEGSVHPTVKEVFTAVGDGADARRLLRILVRAERSA